MLPSIIYREFVCVLYCTSIIDIITSSFIFFFNDTATTEIYTYLHTLSLHDALPICMIASNTVKCMNESIRSPYLVLLPTVVPWVARATHRSEEHTSELQSLMRISYAVFCLNKKKQKTEQYK